MAYILVQDGEVIKASLTHDFSEDVSDIIERSIDEELEEAGYDSDSVDSDKRAEFAIAAGYNGGYAYADEVDMDEDDEDGEFETRNGDVISYSDVAYALRNDQYDENGDLIDEYYEDDYCYDEGEDEDYDEDYDEDESYEDEDKSYEEDDDDEYEYSDTVMRMTFDD